MYIGLHGNNSYPCQILMKIGFSQLNFRNYSNIKWSGNPSSGRQVVPYRRTGRQTDRQTYI